MSFENKDIKLKFEVIFSKFIGNVGKSIYNKNVRKDKIKKIFG